MLLSLFDNLFEEKKPVAPKETKGPEVKRKLDDFEDTHLAQASACVRYMAGRKYKRDAC